MDQDLIDLITALKEEIDTLTLTVRSLPDSITISQTFGAIEAQIDKLDKKIATLQSGINTLENEIELVKNLTHINDI